MSKNMTAPKAAAQFIEDAKAAGFTVKVTASEQNFEVYVERPDERDSFHWVSASVMWQVMNVAPNNSILGFTTTYKRGVRFSYASVKNLRGKYTCPTSLRQVRGEIGLAA